MSDDEDLTNLSWLHSAMAPSILPQPPTTGLGGLPSTGICGANPRCAGQVPIELVRPATIKKPTSLTSSSSRTSTTTASVMTSTVATNVKKKLLIHQKTNFNELEEEHHKLMLLSNFNKDPNAKPPFSYAALICLAMRSCKKKMTLSQIYKWIKENFAFYRNGDRSWQV